MANPSTDKPTLFIIPQELRDDIIRLATTYHRVDGSPVIFTTQTLQNLRNHVRRPYATCKALRQVLEPAFFMNNIFEFATANSGCVREGIEALKNRFANPDNVIYYGTYHIHNLPRWPPPQRSEIRAGPGRTRHDSSRRADFGIELPPPSIRPLITHIKIKLTVPGTEGTSAVQEWGGYTHLAVDWLYPVRELESLGFKDMKLVWLEITYNEHIERRSDIGGQEPGKEQIEERLRAWVEGQAQGMVWEAKVIKIDLKWKRW